MCVLNTYKYYIKDNNNLNLYFLTNSNIKTINVTFNKEERKRKKETEKEKIVGFLRLLALYR